MTFQKYIVALKNPPKPELVIDFGEPVKSADIDRDEDVEIGEWEADSNARDCGQQVSSPKQRADIHHFICHC